MIKIGCINTLKVTLINEEGALLGNGEPQIHLPGKECHPGMRPGDQLDVFVYQHSSGDLRATQHTPRALVGEFALLPVKQIGKHGAFLDWGIQKDLLVPYAEQNEKMQEGRSYLVKVCLDSTNRIVGTAKIERCLQTDNISVKVGEQVDLILWKFTDLGAKVIVNSSFEALLYKDQAGSSLKRGDRMTGYVSRIRDDGKIDVTLRKPGIAGIDAAKQKILSALDANGHLSLNDNSSPAEIQQTLGLSKKVFKKAVGGLLKEEKILLKQDGIEKAQTN